MPAERALERHELEMPIVPGCQLTVHFVNSSLHPKLYPKLQETVHCDVPAIGCSDFVGVKVFEYVADSLDVLRKFLVEYPIPFNNSFCQSA